MIQVSHLSFSYGRSADGTTPAERPALSDISLDFRPGELVALVGPNGSGKSTLARHLDGLLLPTEGTVTVDGLPTSEPSDLPSIRRLVGMVFQDPDEQIVGTTVEEEIAFGLEVQGVDPAVMRRLVDDALAFVGLVGQGGRSPLELSGGQRQNLAIAGAVAAQARYLVLDEPTSMLDTRTRASVMRTLRRLRDERGMGVVLVTHEMDEAVGADRVVALADGTVRFDGAPRELFADAGRLASLGLTDPEPLAISRGLRARGALPGLALGPDELVDMVMDASGIEGRR